LDNLFWCSHLFGFRLVYVWVLLSSRQIVSHHQAVDLVAVDRLDTFLVVGFASVLLVELYQFIDCVVIL
jgi:hypothetical protein